MCRGENTQQERKREELTSAKVMTCEEKNVQQERLQLKRIAGKKLYIHKLK